MGEAIREHGFLVDKLVGLSDEIVDLAPPSQPREQVVSLCSFSTSAESHHMELAPGGSDAPTWPSGMFEKGDKLTVTGNPKEITLMVRGTAK